MNADQRLFAQIRGFLFLEAIRVNLRLTNDGDG